MQLKKGQIVELLISDIAFGGAGIGKLDMEGENFVVFVEGVAPGDKIQAQLFKIKKNYAEASLVKIVTPSSKRTTPRCKHFGVCGGCSLQFLPYEEQIKWKEKMVKDALEKIGGFQNLTIDPIIGNSSPWFYRNKMEYTFGCERDASEVMLGLHPKRYYKQVFDLEECFLESELSVKILDSVRQWANKNKLKPYDPRENRGVLKNLVVREGKNTNELLVNLLVNGDSIPLKEEFAAFMREQFPQITSLYGTTVFVKKGHRTAVKEELLYGKPTLTETLTISPEGQTPTTLTFDILPQAFFQPNTIQAQTLYSKVVEYAEPKSDDIVLDLFCGTGTIGMFFAKYVKKVFGVDLVPSAIENAKSSAARNKVSNSEFMCADVGALLHKLETKPTILITDPPRAGIAPSALEKILALKIPKWIYVSCNPTTLARDLKLAAEKGYKLEKVQPVDMFPQTYHIETVCQLTL